MIYWLIALHNIGLTPIIRKKKCSFRPLFFKFKKPYFFFGSILLKGVIRNRAKDGSEYIVDSVILPLLDEDNNIIEYLGIRHDVTKLEQYKNDLKKQLDIAVKDIIDTQKEVVFTMGAIGETRSKETGIHVKRVAEYSYILENL